MTSELKERSGVIPFPAVFQLAEMVAKEKKLEVVRPTKPHTHENITDILKELKPLLIKGVDFHEQFASVGVILLKFDDIIVLMARAVEFKVCKYGACAKNLINISFVKNGTGS